MSRRIFHGRVGRSLALLALAAYSSVGLFGYGLHRLWQCEHCPADMAAAAGLGCESETCCSADHADHRHEDASSSRSTLSSNGDDCTICSFLAQAQTSVVSILAADGLEPLAEIVPGAQRLELALAVETPQARGPPLS